MAVQQRFWQQLGKSLLVATVVLALLSAPQPAEAAKKITTKKTTVKSKKVAPRIYATQLPAGKVFTFDDQESAVNNLLQAADTLVGTPYRYGGISPSGFDCSGFTSYILSSALGITLPHNAAAQAYYGIPIEKDKLQPGDLVFFSYYGSSGIQHVGIYVGDGQFIHASRSDGVIYSTLENGYFAANYRGARRIIG